MCFIIRDSVTITAVSRGRGARQKVPRVGIGCARRSRHTSSGSSTSEQQHQKPGGLEAYSAISAAATIPCYKDQGDTLWVNNRGDVLSE